jgi:CubicO group peptidase (beta-lactamase class C family)
MRLGADLEALADEHDFSGVAAVSQDGDHLVALARGFADRANGRPNILATRFAIASATKGLTALTVASLIESGELRADTTLRSLLPDALPTVDPTVTIEQLLGHTSGVGDYLDESELGDVDEYVMTVPVHLLDSPSRYLPAIEGFPQKAAPGSGFAYNNGGFVMLSIAVEVATGRSFYDLVQERVLEPAGMDDTSFERSDRLPAGAAIGYLEDGRSNVLHLPVRGAGDGGAYSTTADLEALWRSLFAGRILPIPVVDRLVAPRNDVPSERRRYGLGFWLRADRDAVMLEGMDAGVSCRTVHDRPSGLGYTVISNTSSGAWPLVAYLDEQMPTLAGSPGAGRPAKEGRGVGCTSR